MKVTKAYEDDIMKMVHETASGFFEAGTIDKKTMREFDELCLTPVIVLTPADIRAIRRRTGASQHVFARYLNVTPGVISQWERGVKRPAGTSLKMLHLVDKKGLETIA